MALKILLEQSEVFFFNFSIVFRDLSYFHGSNAKTQANAVQSARLVFAKINRRHFTARLHRYFYHRVYQMSGKCLAAGFLWCGGPTEKGRMSLCVTPTSVLFLLIVICFECHKKIIAFTV